MADIEKTDPARAAVEESARELWADRLAESERDGTCPRCGAALVDGACPAGHAW